MEMFFVFAEIRHSCEMGDELTYNWIQHDGRSFGHQRIDDPKNGISIDIDILMQGLNLHDILDASV